MYNYPEAVTAAEHFLPAAIERILFGKVTSSGLRINLLLTVPS